MTNRMRRADREITDKKVLEKILSTNTICHLALSADNQPYIVPLNYGYQDNTIYIHSASEGRKIAMLKTNRNVCVEITDSAEMVSSERACGFSMKYRSVITEGTAKVLEDSVEKLNGLQIIMRQQTGKKRWDIPDQAVRAVAVIRIDLNSITGKSS